MRSTAPDFVPSYALSGNGCYTPEETQAIIAFSELRQEEYLTLLRSVNQEGTELQNWLSSYRVEEPSPSSTFAYLRASAGMSYQDCITALGDANDVDD